MDLRLALGADSIETASVVSAILNSTHHGVQDFAVTIPAALLAEQQRSQTIFTYVMVAIAAISLLVGGIGIMNIVLATVLERTRERRAARHRVRLPALVDDCPRRSVENYRHQFFYIDGLRSVRGRGCGVRNLSGGKGIANRSDRGASI